MADGYGRGWILSHAIPIIDDYDTLTVRQLYYRLVAAGMPNSMRHYKRVVSAMTDARWSGKVSFRSFIDREREIWGETEYLPTDVDSAVDKASEQVRLWMQSYHKNTWENQPYYVEVWIEKKALQGVFEPICDEAVVALSPCKGYPSLTFLHDAAIRFREAYGCGKECVILYYGDYDPSGQDIPRSIEENLSRLGVQDVLVDHAALHPRQIRELGLPGTPPKSTDSRTARWSGSGTVELDAVDPHTLSDMCRRDISKYFDQEEYHALLRREREERKDFMGRMKEAVMDMSEED